MDVAKAYTFVTEDERWLTKIGIGVLVMLASTIFLLIPLPLLYGYRIGITRNVMTGAKRPLPEWDDLGKLFVDGLYVMLSLFIYTLPVWLLVCVGLGVTIFPIVGAASESAQITEVAAGITAVTWIILSCLILIFALALAFITPALSIQYARTGEFSATLRVGEVLGITRDRIGDILIVMLASLLASIVLQTVVGALSATGCLLIIALPLGWLGSVWISAASSHMHGQIAAKLGYAGAQKEPESFDF